MSFEKLLKELEGVEAETSTLAKSVEASAAADDAAIEAAAAEGVEGEDINPEDDEDEDELIDGDETLVKSMVIDGEEVSVVDAELLVKSVSALQKKLKNGEEVMAKAMGSALGMIKAQGDLIKSLSDRLDKVSKLGTGRKSVLSVLDKGGAIGDLAKSQAAGQQNVNQLEEFFAKSDAAFEAGKITGAEFATIDVCRRNGKPVSETLIHKVINS